MSESLEYCQKLMNVKISNYEEITATDLDCLEKTDELLPERMLGSSVFLRGRRPVKAYEMPGCFVIL